MRVLRVLTALALFSVLSSALMAGILLLSTPTEVAAQLPPPPSKPPVDTPTSEPPTTEPSPEPSEEPSAEPSEEPSPEPSEEPSPEPSEEPTEEPAPKPPPSSSQPGDFESRPDPNCQAVVEGDVRDTAGRLVTAAVVNLTGEGLSRTMMTDDRGHYGFGGLCAGTLTVVATLPGGQESFADTVEVDGRSGYRLDLGGPQAASDEEAVTATPGPTEAAQPTPVAEPEMPMTGFAGWPLLGFALLGVLAVLLVGARRLWVAHAGAPGQD